MEKTRKIRNLIIVCFISCYSALLAGCGGSIADGQQPPAIQGEAGTREAQTPPSELPAYRLRTADGMTMVFVPAGSFRMGSTEAEIDDAIELCKEHYSICNRWYYERESPIHLVSLDSYWIDQTEVSNAQYQLCVDAGECTEPLACDKGDPTFDDPDKANHPVVCVGWTEAQNYCHWAGARLPTEAEWEYADRGEIRSIYSWGNDFEGTRLNYCDRNCGEAHADDRFDDGYHRTAPVGSFPSGITWSGASNMSGNVSEWVADWFGDYPVEAVSNPLGPTTGNLRMVKGCSWYFHPTYCRGAARPAIDPDTRFDYLGFRCALSSSTDE